LFCKGGPQNPKHPPQPRSGWTLCTTTPPSSPGGCVQVASGRPGTHPSPYPRIHQHSCSSTLSLTLSPPPPTPPAGNQLLSSSIQVRVLSTNLLVGRRWLLRLFSRPARGCDPGGCTPHTLQFTTATLRNTTRGGRKAIHLLIRRPAPESCGTTFSSTSLPLKVWQKTQRASLLLWVAWLMRCCTVSTTWRASRPL